MKRIGVKITRFQ